MPTPTSKPSPKSREKAREKTREQTPGKARGKARATSRKPLLYGAGVIAVAALLGYVSYRATAPEPRSAGSSVAADVTADPQDGVYPELAKLARRDSGDKLALGRADAPVVLIEYADFKCGYCAKFARDTEPALVKKYVDEGVLRIEWRNFPIFGAESEAVARASWAAGQQDRFWEFHRAAYAEGVKEKGFGKDRLKALARRAGVADLDRFARDTDGPAAAAAVGEDQEQGYSIGATSTPSFLINGRPIAGAQPIETFTDAIERAAAAAGPSGTKGSAK
ncbi:MULTISPECIES: DsbA family protein [unclassified Streptomyces]|uniref:DsbA family protein n=1 Tax=unclassified Streptomyces TaxID=2593676 RepID=UPI000380E78C|nr:MULTISPECIES: DsbA family protein [unclassified Streptomyces]MYY05159.1 thioredoxin domain-containing protein [Streptomyces sp. SID4913]